MAGSPTADALPVTKSDSVFPKGAPMPTLVRLPEDEGFGDGGEKGQTVPLSLKKELAFSEVYTFSKHVRDGIPWLTKIHIRRCSYSPLPNRRYASGLLSVARTNLPQAMRLMRTKKLAPRLKACPSLAPSDMP